MLNKTIIQIIDDDEEAEAIQLLFGEMKSKMERARWEAQETKATLNLIRKINQGKNKDIEAVLSPDPKEDSHGKR